MDTTIEEMQERHNAEIENFIKDCSHTDVIVEDGGFGGDRIIVLRCKRCGLNLLGFSVTRSHSYLAYVRDCVNGHPDSRKRGCTATNKKNIFDKV